MKCKHKYSKMQTGYSHHSPDLDMKDLAKAGNKSIDGLIGKCVAVKKRGCK